mgnify:FL=1
MSNAAEAKKEERKLLEFNVTEPEPFHETYRVELTTATQLTYLLDKFFGDVFNDYHKCQLTPIANNISTASPGYELNLLFRPQVKATEEFDSNGKVAAFVPKAESETFNANNVMYKNIKRINNNSKTANQFMISQPACELLRSLFLDQSTLRDRDFISNPNPKKYCNLGLVGERTVQENIGYMRQANLIENVIMHVDVNKVLQMIKGDEAKDGSKLLYSIRPLTDIYASVPQAHGYVQIRSETAIEILCLNADKWDAYSAILGSNQSNQEVVSPTRQIRY